MYYPNKVKCLEENISYISVPTATVSNDKGKNKFNDFSFNPKRILVYYFSY